MNNIVFDRNKPFNGLPLLPPPEKVIDKGILLKWGLAGRALAELNKNILRLPNPTMLVNTISLQEAKSSSEIENIFTTDDELYKAISDKIKEENSPPQVKEVLRYREALWAGYSEIRQKKKIDADLIVKVYQQVKNTSQNIRPPQSLVTIKRGGSSIGAGEIIYTPPRGKGVIETLMKNMLEYLNDNQEYTTDPLLKMVIAHYQFEAIHPFTDGNGRTGRILNLLYLVHQNLLTLPVLYMSKFIIENKDDYYHYLAAVTQRNSWKKWILFMLEAVEQTSVYTNRLIDEIIAQMEVTLATGKAHLKWFNKEINETIFSQPYIKPRTIGKLLGRTSRTTLIKYMTDLERLQILSPKKDGKEVYYLNNDLIRILEG
ncbi:MAG: Fic family protein [Chlorobi bacterium]|nr:Fic family protein [Chlorobiota bacterium]